MAIPVRCAQCGKDYAVKDELAGRDVRCPACSAVIHVPEVSASATAPTPTDSTMPAQPGPAPTLPTQVPELNEAMLMTKAASSVKMIGIFNVIVGVLSLLWSPIYILSMVSAVAEAERDPNAPPAAALVVIFLGFVVLAVVGGILQLKGGIDLLKRKPQAWKWGLIAGITSCTSLVWGCCVFPFCAASGITTLIILNNAHVKRLLR